MSVVITIYGPPNPPPYEVHIARSITPTIGSLAQVINRKVPLSGVITEAGTLGIKLFKATNGTITASGIVTIVRITTLKTSSASGQLLNTITGNLTQTTARRSSINGSLTNINGALVTRQYKTLLGYITETSGVVDAWTENPDVDVVGYLTPSGLLNAITIYVQSLAGEIESSGELSTINNLVEHAFLDGEITSEGVLAVLPDKVLAGVITPSGALIAGQFIPLSGEVTPSAELGTQFIDKDKHISVEGSIDNCYNDLTVGVIYDETWRPPFTGRANKYNFTIEQGTRFERRFRWMHDDGVTPYDMNRFTLTMQIRAYAGADEVIADSNDGSITISTEAGGYFTIMIGEEITRGFNFTRAVYNIETSYQVTNIVRLIEGDIRLSKDPNITFHVYDTAMSGMCGNITGMVSTGKIYRQTLTGQITAQATVSSPPFARLQGVIEGNRIIGNLSIVSQLNTLGGTITPTGAIQMLIATNLEGGLEDLSGELEAINPFECSGELDDLSGEVTTESLFLCELAGTVEMTGS